MTSLGDVIRKQEEQLFVGREAETERFRSWLRAENEPAELLNVSGPGGTGKSALLRAFRRIAMEEGRRVILVDGRDFRSTPEGLLTALTSAWGVSGPTGLAEVVESLNREQPLLLFDTFEELGDLTRHLRDEVLARLQGSVRVVIAGRFPLGLVWSRDDPWHRLIRPMPLEGFSSAIAQDYLKRRGVDGRLAEEIISATGGHPLALGLAADLAGQRALRDFKAAPEWRMVVHALLERLLEDTSEPELRDLVEACAVVRQFDEATLTALQGDTPTRGAFDKLCRLSFVRPAAHGLMLHDDVRRILVEDLRWRHPERYRTLRLRALAHYRERARVAPADERERLLSERLFQWEHSVAQALLFEQEAGGQVWVEQGGPEDHEDVMRIWLYWLTNVLTREIPAAIDGERERAFLQRVLDHASPRLRIVREPDGQAVGFGLAIPMWRGAMEVLDSHPRRELPRAYWTPEEIAALPDRPQEARAFYAGWIGHTDWHPAAVNAALLRDLVGLVAGEGVYMASVTLPRYKPLVEALGFELVPRARTSYWGGQPADGYVLDLRGVGVDAWFDAIITGTRPAETTALLKVSGTAVELSLREREVAALVAKGHRNREIGERLFISVRTVEAHIEHIFQKLEVNSRVELAAWAMAHGLVDPGQP